MIRQRAVGDGFHEELTILNHAEQPVDLTVRIDAGGDFADLFEVKDALAKKGKYYHRGSTDGRLLLGYERETFRRETLDLVHRAGRRRRGRPDLRPCTSSRTAQWTTELDVVTALLGVGRAARAAEVRPRAPRPAAHGAEPASAGSTTRRSWTATTPLKQTYHRSLVDLAALRFAPPSPAARSLPAAGLPWFMTMFGRDSIFTSLQALPFVPELAATTLKALADWQGSRVDDFRDEDPGRILHEMRYGEMTAFEERPTRPTTATPTPPRCSWCCSTSTSGGPATPSWCASWSTRRGPR